MLDTNVVLDWLLFRNPDCARLGEWLLAGKARWLVTAAMQDELEHVLAHGRLDRWNPDLPALLAIWGRLAVQLDAPAASAPATRLRCSDPDDQKFIDLALTSGARWLLSHDRAVLKLARAARERGLDILTPSRWAAASLTG